MTPSLMRLDDACARGRPRGSPGLMPIFWRTRAWKLAAVFFLTDLYGSEDLSRLDANVRRIVPAIKRMMPAASLEIVADAVELEGLSEELDVAMAKAIGAKSNKLSAATYGAAYRKVDRRADRERQIHLIENLGESLDRLVHRPFIGTTLSVTPMPARLVGLGEIHDFLERGYRGLVTRT